MKQIIHLRISTKKKLDELKKEKETYNDVIERLLDLEERQHEIYIKYR